jgi:UDP-glucose/galactose:(glucosyl)LPS alpha-1,2-glucosyl/galactosyltransferase
MNIDFHKVILQKVEFDYTGQAKAKKINIAYGIDRNFLFGAGISMASVLINNKDIDVHFYLVTDYVDNDYVAHIKELAEKYCTAVTILVFNNENFHHLPCTKAWSYAMYYRYFAFEYLSRELDSVLYLDADVICKGSLRELTEIKFNGEYAAIVHDVDEVRLKSGERLGIPELSNSYFNSGVVFANLILWRECGLLQKAFDILQDKQRELLYFDQDALNILYCGHVITLRRDFNCIYGIDHELKISDRHEYKNYITESAILIHYVGVTKPWHNWADYPASTFFITAYKQSPWAQEPLLAANSAKLYKRRSRHEKAQGKTLRSILSHVMYIKSKLSSSR